MGTVDLRGNGGWRLAMRDCKSVGAALTSLASFGLVRERGCVSCSRPIPTDAPRGCKKLAEAILSRSQMTICEKLKRGYAVA